MTKGEAMKTLGEPVEVQEPIALVERRAFLKLPIEERRKIMAKQAEKWQWITRPGKLKTWRPERSLNIKMISRRVWWWVSSHW
jgi:hypothetical protein